MRYKGFNKAPYKQDKAKKPKKNQNSVYLLQFNFISGKILFSFVLGYGNEG